ncbi:hypothetical protein MKW94_012016 [Papaver nudicaule]|uniref:Bet v I/Major latex protein domain-containing protein n=1 Tax=Papaver nudicaule TaxID=74823 RepID=A0AA42B342_PAPNU|nr:hypothetical protein [Papaver nudicaule]
MAQIQKLGLEVAEVKCSATKFYGFYKNNITQLVKCFPEIYKSVQVTEGDGASVGSARFWKYELINHYTSFGFKLVSVTCSVKWYVEFEKANEDVPSQTSYITLLDKITQGLPSQLL